MSRHIYAIKNDDGKLVLFTRLSEAREYESLNVAASVWEKFDAWMFGSGFLRAVDRGQVVDETHFVHPSPTEEPWTLLKDAEWRSTLKPPAWLANVESEIERYGK